MKEQETIEKCMSIVDGFDGNESEYIVLLYKLIDECQTRIEITEMELE